MKSIYILITLLIFLFKSGSSQNLNEDLVEMNSAYHLEKPMEFKVQYSYYDDNNMSIAKDTLTGEMIVCKSGFSYKIGKKVFLKNKRCAIKVDHRRKTIELLNPALVSFDNNPLAMIDSLNKKYQPVSRIILDNKLRRSYRVTYAKGMIKTIDLTMFKKTHLIENIVIYFDKDIILRDDLNKSAVLKLNFSDYSNIRASVNALSEEKYIRLEDQQAKLKEPFSHYQLINHLN